jgi:hypothetical protein
MFDSTLRVFAVAEAASFPSRSGESQTIVDVATGLIVDIFFRKLCRALTN